MDDISSNELKRNSMSNRLKVILFSFGIIIFACQCGDDSNLNFPTNERKSGPGESCLKSNDCELKLLCWEQQCKTENEICQLKQEICDGLDNNCNGKIDEGFDIGGICYQNFDACVSEGKKICLQENEVTCQAPIIEIMPEFCNGLDDDCNGLVDDSTFENGQNCWVEGGFGPEFYGTLDCALGSLLCIPPISTPEDCSDIFDNDFDNLVNEDCPCVPNEKLECYLGPIQTKDVGVCIETGVLTCGANGKFIGACQNQNIFVSKENSLALCRNKKDDDCDGKTDQNDSECLPFP